MPYRGHIVRQRQTYLPETLSEDESQNEFHLQPKFSAGGRDVADTEGK